MPTSARKIPQFGWAVVESGIPLSMFDRFNARSRFTVEDLKDVVISVRALKRRRERQKTLTMNESDRMARVARIYALAVQVLGTPRKARQWLRMPAIQWEGKAPLAMLRSEIGGRAVERALCLIQVREPA
jgi:putative toxin-antitoxin system antitoxin component (TIGR02293 family)